MLRACALYAAGCSGISLGGLKRFLCVQACYREGRSCEHFSWILDYKPITFLVGPWSGSRCCHCDQEPHATGIRSASDLPHHDPGRLRRQGLLLCLPVPQGEEVNIGRISHQLSRTVAVEESLKWIAIVQLNPSNAKATFIQIT